METDSSQLQQAQEHIANRLTSFFNREEFQHFRFVLSEFDLFTLFLASAAWLRSGEDDEAQQTALIEFHKAHLVAMVDRILDAQVQEVNDEQAETMTEMVQNIHETRLRDYFALMQQTAKQDSHHFLTALTDAFLEKFVSYDDPQLLTLVTALVTELFHDCLAFFKKGCWPK